MRPNSKRSPGITLVELILATLLLSVVIMTGLSMEVGLRRLYMTTDREAELMGEAAPILTFISKKIAQAPGDFNHNPYRLTSVLGAAGWDRYSFKRDDNVNGLWDATDGWEDFTWLKGPDQLWYGRDNTAIVMLSDKVVNFRVDDPHPVLAAPALGFSNVMLILRHDPAIAVNGSNPEVILNVTAQYRAMSLR